MAKRIFDIVLSLFLLITLSWLFVAIIVVYTITIQFPVFFIQERIGKDEKIFRIIKFRTLKPGNGPTRARRFWLGDVLRFLSLDELPQLVNVLKADMSLVGPRPLPASYRDRFTPWQRRRHTVRPGITGWAQVNGRHSIPWEEKFRLDLYYIDNWSLAFDVRILFRTLTLMFAFRRDTSLEEGELNRRDAV